MISGDSIENTAFIERDEEIVDRKFCSTKSGIVQCVDDGEIYVITTGHYMNENCFPSNPNYTLIGRMWPSALELKDADDIVNKKGYDSLLDDGSKPPCVSDVAILKPNIDIRTIGTCTRLQGGIDFFFFSCSGISNRSILLFPIIRYYY